MLELFFLMWFGRRLADLATRKGRTKWWAALGVGFWVAGEVTGVIVGSLLGLDLGAYAIALLFAISGAIAAWFVVSALPPGDVVPEQF